MYDPEIPVNITTSASSTALTRTRTAGSTFDDTHLADVPGSRLAARRRARRIESIDGAIEVHVDLVWDPPWGPEQLSEAARLQLGLA